MRIYKVVFRSTLVILLTVVLFGYSNSKSTNAKKGKIKVLIVDGQNNHDVWPKSTIMMKQYLEETGLFTVDVSRSNFIWKSEREKSYLPLANVGVKETSETPKTDQDF